MRAEITIHTFPLTGHVTARNSATTAAQQAGSTLAGMVNTSKRIRALAATAATAAAMFLAQVALPGTAHARCAGENNPVLLKLTINGTTYASEEAYSAWCNGNGTYKGRFRSHNSNYVAYVQSMDDGQWDLYQGADDLGWTDWQTEDDNSHLRIALCVKHKTTGWWTCGVGSNSVNSSPSDGPQHTFSESNEGF